MTLYILDTDILTLVQEGHASVIARLATRQPQDVAITIISVEEQLSGWYRQLRLTKQPDALARVYDRLTATVRPLARLPLLSFSEPAIKRSRVLQTQGLNVRKMDLSIAAIALEHQATVVTRNVRDFQRVPSLLVEDWSK